ncbi:MAG: amidohydrolase family protein [Saprospiraceae bacterium]|nr:amidohydrolase family protein [Bacteroidia bacterium]NNE14827.1 amidohydrolase family protein [Saprospiraceae bacterium]NNL90614.1 amidohydrolase family protein [Saprospiraceae bacterium]
MKIKFFPIAVFMLLIMNKSQAQIDYNNVPEVTQKIFINDANIQKNPSTNLGIGDILIEDGLIKQVGVQLTPPIDAKIIEADSAYAYAAFIDAMSHIGIPKSDEKRKRPDVKFKGFPPNKVAGITPQLKASSFIEHDDASIKSLRESGFAIAHVVPRGKMLPGQGSVISLSGSSSQDMIIKDNYSMFLQFTGASGVYPNTIIGVMAKWKDLYYKAHYHNKNLQSYKINSSGIKRPKEDKVLNALIPVTEKSMPVFMKTNKAKDIFRAIALQESTGYPLVLGDVKQIGGAENKLKEKNLTVLLSVGLPKAEKEEKKDSTITDESKKALMKRKKESYTAYLSQAAQLEKAGIPFAFSFLSSKPKDLKTNIQKLIKHGLSTEASLAALTTNPAKILGIDKIAGTIDKGKLANIILTDNPYFEKKSRIKYVFVEGQMTEIKEVKKKKKGGARGKGKENLIGKWTYSVDVFGTQQTGNLTISEDGDDLKIEFIADSNPDEISEGRDITYEDGNLTYVVTVDGGGQEMDIEISLDFEGDQFTGTASMEGMESLPMEGNKISSPEK